MMDGVYLTLSLINAFVLCLTAYKFFQTLQLNNYKLNKFIGWFKNTNGKYFSRLAIMSLMSSAVILVINTLFGEYFDGALKWLGLMFYFAIFICFITYESKLPKKKPLAFTSRVMRLYSVLFILAYAFTLGVLLLSAELVKLSGFFTTFDYMAISLSPIVLPFLTLLSALIMTPYERMRYVHYKKKSYRVLQDRKDLIKIGITGSYGKTSVKNFLTQMLAEKYIVHATPSSYNTPMGISKSVSKLKDEDEIFIAEMGARNLGDIVELCALVEPKYAIITGIGNQHLETFRTEENIRREKFELVKSLDSDGFAVISSDSAGSVEMMARTTKCEKVLAGIDGENLFAKAKDINCGKGGSTFVLSIDGKDVECSTVLLGRHSISNIVVAAALAYRLGVAVEDIADAISELKPVLHRLELIENTNNITVIDDTFNASVEGTQAALETLNMFDGRKIIITPGLVELGVREKQINKEFGARIAKVADKVYLIGQIRSAPIKDGLSESGFDENMIEVYNSLKDVKSILKKELKAGDVVLWENDLPDDYNEN